MIGKHDFCHFLNNRMRPNIFDFRLKSRKSATLLLIDVAWQTAVTGVIHSLSLSNEAVKLDKQREIDMDGGYSRIKVEILESENAERMKECRNNDVG